jgi:hypothetical protein
MVGDAAILIREGNIPAALHGPGGQGAHADLESLAVAGLARAARVYIRTAIDYSNAEKSKERSYSISEGSQVTVSGI